MKLLLFFLIVLVLGQRGRGGSSSRSFRPSSLSFTRSYRPSFYPTYSIGLPMHTTTITKLSCVDQCKIKHALSPEPLKQCIALCSNTNKNRSWITFVIIGIVGFLCCGCCGWAAYQQIRNENAEQIIQYHADMSLNSKLERNRIQYIEDTKRRLNNVATNYMALQQFELEKETFQKENWKLYYFQMNKQITNNEITFYMKNQTPFQYSFTSRGTDEIGSWTGNGYYLCTDQGITVWMLKDYDDRQNAQQTGEYGLLMYEGNQIDRKKYQGKWYYVGFENDTEVSGKWTMVSKQSANPTNPYQAQYF